MTKAERAQLGELIGGSLVLLTMLAVAAAIIGGAGAIAADLLFFSHTFGPIAELGLEALIGGALCIAIGVASEGIGKLIYRSNSRREPNR
jgi:hypothetical protein